MSAAAETGPMILPFRIHSESADPSEGSILSTYERLCAGKDLEANTMSAIRSTRSGIVSFEDWYRRKCGGAITVRGVVKAPELLWQFAGDSLACGSAVDTVKRKLAAIGKVLNVWGKLHRTEVLPELPSGEALQKLCRQHGADSPFDSVEMPETVTLEEFRRLRESCCVATWPEVGAVSARAFWECLLDCHWTYGFRSQDWFGIQSRSDRGLLWSQVSLSGECPIRQLKGLTWPHGWVCFWMRKGRRHLVLPLSSRVRSHLERFRQCAGDRVFPIPHSKRLFYSNFERIKSAAGVDSRITLSGRSTPSLRKGSTAYWDSVASGNLTSVVLGHSLQSRSNRAAVTDKHYAQLVRLVCDHIEQVPF